MLQPVPNKATRISTHLSKKCFALSTGDVADCDTTEYNDTYEDIGETGNIEGDTDGTEGVDLEFTGTTTINGNDTINNESIHKNNQGYIKRSSSGLKKVL